MPFCTSCGQSLNLEARFCSACGAPVALPTESPFPALADESIGATPPHPGPVCAPSVPLMSRLSCTCCHLVPEHGDTCPACGIPCTNSLPDSAISLLRLAEAAVHQRNWTNCQTLADRLLELDLRTANAWMLRGEARFCSRFQLGDWTGVHDLIADYRSAMDVQDVRSQSLMRFFHQRFLDLVETPIAELIQRTRVGLGERAAELQPLSNMDMNIWGSPWGLAKASKNARNHEEAKALMTTTLPALAATRQAAENLSKDSIDETPLSTFIQNLARTETELTEVFQSISEKADDNTLGDVLFGKWSRKYRS